MGCNKNQSEPVEAMNKQFFFRGFSCLPFIWFCLQERKKFFLVLLNKHNGYSRVFTPCAIEMWYHNFRKYQIKKIDTLSSINNFMNSIDNQPGINTFQESIWCQYCYLIFNTDTWYCYFVPILWSDTFNRIDLFYTLYQ